MQNTKKAPAKKNGAKKQTGEEKDIDVHLSAIAENDINRVAEQEGGEDDEDK